MKRSKIVDEHCRPLVCWMDQMSCRWRRHQANSPTSPIICPWNPNHWGYTQTGSTNPPTFPRLSESLFTRTPKKAEIHYKETISKLPWNQSRDPSWWCFNCPRPRSSRLRMQCFGDWQRIRTRKENPYIQPPHLHSCIQRRWYKKCKWTNY